jgi:hypothetical protein
MKLETVREAYQDFSGKASEIARYMGYAGLAVIWIFTTELPANRGRVPTTLIPAAIAIVLGLALDFLQYAYGAAIWGWYGRKKEIARTPPNKEFEAPAWYNWPTDILFWSKLVVMAVAYAFILAFLWGRLL